MKKNIRKSVSIFLTFILVSSFSAYSMEDTAWGADNPDKEGVILIRDAYENRAANLRVRADGKSEIFAKAEDIASICKAEIINDTENKTVILERNGYRITVYLNGEEAVLSNKQGAVTQQVFPVKNITDEDGTVWLPLEKSMYLLNSGWQIADDEVLVETPSDTFWNMLNEFEDLVSHRPMVSDLVGTGWERYKNSAEYAILSLADELDYRLFIPGLSSGIEAEKYEKAILSLGDVMPEAENPQSVESKLSELIGLVRTGAEDAANFYGAPHNISDIGKFLSDLGAKPFHAWENIQDPLVAEILKKENQWVKNADALAIVQKAFEASDRIKSIQGWSQGFTEQIKALSESDISWISDSDGKHLAFLIQDTANTFYERNQSAIMNSCWEAVWQTADLIFSKGFELNVVGKAIAVIDIAVEAAKLVSPDLAKKLKTADTAFEGKTTIDLATMATYNCADFLNTLTGKSEISPEDLQSARNSYLLMLNTYMRSWDKIIQVKESEDGSDADKESEWKQLKDTAYALMVRMNESLKYDNTLIMQTDYGNIYNEDYRKGMVREKIPVSIIEERHQSEGMILAGHVIGTGDGTVYYWEYDDSSFEKSAPLSNYQPNIGEKNRIVKCNPSGEKVLIGDLEGEGFLALAENGLLFYEKPIDQTGRREICSIDSDSGEIKTYGEGHIRAVEGKYIICSDAMTHKIDRINAENGKRINLTYGTFLTVHENLIYYQPIEGDTEAAIRGKATLSVLDVQGEQHRSLYSTEPDLYEEAFQGACSITELVFKDEYIYFSYGSYEGSGSAYAGGKIMRVKKDGTGAEVVAGSDVLQGPVFSVCEDGKIISQSMEEPYVYIYPMDQFFADKGSIYFLNEKGEAEELILQADYASVGNVACGQWNEDEAINIRFAEKKWKSDLRFTGTRSHRSGEQSRLENRIYPYKWCNAA